MNGAPTQDAKVVFITGCSKGGIGFELCEQFAEQGCRVYASSRKVESMERFKHPAIRRLTVDVTNDEDVNRAISFVIEEEGKLDILVSNAGCLCIGPVLDITVDQARDTFDTNVFATLRLVRATVPHMVERKQGLIVTIGSVAGELPTPFNGLYCASKAALHSLTETLHMELAPFGIKALLVLPASVKSNIAQNHSKVFQLPPNSIYKSYIDRIVARMYMSQSEGTMPTATFAKHVVEKALMKSPPLYYRGGAMIWRWVLLAWLPRWYALRLIWKKVMGKSVRPRNVSISE